MNEIRWVFAQGGWVSYALAAVSVLLWSAVLVRAQILWPANPLSPDAGKNGPGALAHFLRDAPRFRNSPGRLKMRARRALRRLEMMRDVISTLVVIAPLLGLLGTVTGMVEMFGSLQSTAGTGGEQTVAGGISTAMVTTQLGLVIAAPGVIVAYWLTRQQMRRERDIHDVLHAIEESMP